MTDMDYSDRTSILFIFTFSVDSVGYQIIYDAQTVIK
jgi:hypothetical protein